jgi:hypothetical protein
MAPLVPLTLSCCGRAWCREEIIKEVQSNTVEEMEQNVESITQWVSQHQRR